MLKPISIDTAALENELLKLLEDEGLNQFKYSCHFLLEFRKHVLPLVYSLAATSGALRQSTLVPLLLVGTLWIDSIITKTKFGQNGRLGPWKSWNYGNRIIEEWSCRKMDSTTEVTATRSRGRFAVDNR